MLKFYYAKNSAAYAPHILLEDVGADYEAVKIDFASGEQRQDAYLGINPKGRRPFGLIPRYASWRLSLIHI